MRFSIRYQLLLPLFLLLLGMAGVSMWTAIASASQAKEAIEDDVRNLAKTLSTKNFTLNFRTLDAMKSLTGADLVLLDSAGKVAVDSAGPASTLPSLAVELPPAVAVVDDWYTLKLGPPVRIGDHTFLCSGIVLRDGSTLYVLYPESLWSSALWTAIRPSLVLGVFGGVASLLLGVVMVKRLGRRIQELERRTRLIAAGDFSPMPLPRRNDEIRDLGRSVNDMADRLAQLQETVQQTERLRLLGQVGGGLAHQLRNAVTGASLAVQLHARTCNGDADAESLDVALRQLTLVETNLKRFLDLGRVDQIKREPCNLADVVGEVVALLGPQCRHAHTDLRWQPPQGDFVIQGDAGQLGHLFLNIIANAVEAAGPEGNAEVRMQNAEGRVVVEVSDSGPGPPPEIAEKLFQLFVTGKREGVGLGLAVARQVAEVHGGKIEWRREEGRTWFKVELPGEAIAPQSAFKHGVAGAEYSKPR